MLSLIANIPDGIIGLALSLIVSGQVWQLRMLYELKERLAVHHQIITSCPVCIRNHEFPVAIKAP